MSNFRTVKSTVKTQKTFKMGQNFIFGAKTSPIRPFQIDKKSSLTCWSEARLVMMIGGGWGLHVDHTGGFTRSYMGLGELERAGSG